MGSTSLGLFILQKFRLQNKAVSHTWQQTKPGQAHIATNDTGAHLTVTGIIPHLQLSGRSESSLKILLSHCLSKDAKAASNSLRLQACLSLVPDHPFPLVIQTIGSCLQDFLGKTSGFG